MLRLSIKHHNIFTFISSDISYINWCYRIMNSLDRASIIDNASEANIYTSIDSSSSCIRLLNLQPRQGDNDKTIICSLHLTDLDEDCQYEALPYEWGIPTDNSYFVVVGGRNVQIRENLWHALWHLRDDKEGKVKVLWVDALCIDQKDNEERNHQVKRMARIYTRASLVIAWIGLPGEAAPQIKLLQISSLDHSTANLNSGQCQR